MPSVLERIFFIDGAILVSQQFLTPFGAQPADLSNATQNRYTSANYRVSPYIKGVDVGRHPVRGAQQQHLDQPERYADRDQQCLLQPVAGQHREPRRAHRMVARLRLEQRQVQQSAAADHRADARGRSSTSSTRSVRVSADGGYEDNRYTFTDYRDAIYGVGVQWRPTPRTNLVANWEHRFFGSSYLVSFDHRTPLSAVSVHLSRNITSYPQQFLHAAGHRQRPAAAEHHPRLALSRSGAAAADRRTRSSRSAACRRASRVRSISIRSKSTCRSSGNVHAGPARCAQHGLSRRLLPAHRSDHRRRQYAAAGTRRPATTTRRRA